jgi:hypothetical protein
LQDNHLGCIKTHKFDLVIVKGKFAHDRMVAMSVR